MFSPDEKKINFIFKKINRIKSLFTNENQSESFSSDPNSLNKQNYLIKKAKLIRIEDI